MTVNSAALHVNNSLWLSCFSFQPQRYGICCNATMTSGAEAAVGAKQVPICGLGPRSVDKAVLDETNRIVGGTTAQPGSWPFQVTRIRLSGKNKFRS